MRNVVPSCSQATGKRAQNALMNSLCSGVVTSRTSKGLPTSKKLAQSICHKGTLVLVQFIVRGSFYRTLTLPFNTRSQSDTNNGQAADANLRVKPAATHGQSAGQFTRPTVGRSGAAILEARQRAASVTFPGPLRREFIEVGGHAHSFDSQEGMRESIDRLPTAEVGESHSGEFENQVKAAPASEPLHTKGRPPLTHKRTAPPYPKTP